MSLKLKNDSGWELVAGAFNVEIDDSLTDNTKAANAKKVGDEISRIENLISANIDEALSSTSTNPVQNKVITTALAGKQASGSYVTTDNTDVQSIAGGLVVGGTSATSTGKGRIMVTGNTNPLIGLQAINSSETQLTPYYLQVINDVLMLGSTSAKATSWDANGNMTVQGNASISGALTANSFSGSGANLTALNANNVASGTLAVARGGTGLTASPSMLVNLASSSATNVFTASPRPGVTGVLSIAHGGTGGENAEIARSNLGIGNVGTLTYTTVTF